MTKQEIRKLICKRKKTFTIADSIAESAIVMGLIEDNETFIKAGTALLYWSLPDEVQTVDFIKKWCADKRICLPIINGHELIIRQYLNGCVLNTVDYGITEPDGPLVRPSEIDIAIIPGVAFDKNNNRLGRGKGFYDRLLKGINGLKAGVCYGFQMVDNIPVEEHDIKMDLVIHC